MSRSFIEVDGVRLHVAQDGERGAQPLALLNGAFCNLESWSPVLEALAKRYFVVRHDGRGNGQSGAGARADYRFERYADDLRGILDQLGIERAVICGMAYGARIAARFALRHPDRVQLLALYDVSLAAPVNQELQREGNARAKALRQAEGLPEVTRLREWFAHADEREARRSLTAHEGQPDPTPELAAVKAPTLVVCGRQDVNLEESQRIARVLPNAELHVMEMTGHGSVFSRPDLFASLLDPWIAASLSARGPRPS
jgi:3-oxoadipate enol-lactonase